MKYKVYKCSNGHILVAGPYAPRAKVCGVYENGVRCRKKVRLVKEEKWGLR